MQQAEKDLTGFFKCTLCETKLRRRSNLKVHLANQHGDAKRTQCCQNCGVLCKNKEALRIHIQRYHKV
jgi:uncharacterized Zn-finger protein